MITVVMPMAGLGSRFRSAGETKPKPLIEVAGQPMFLLALGSLGNLLRDAQVIAIVLAEHDAEFGIRRELEAKFPSVTVVTIPSLTGGSLETCLAAEPFVTNKQAPVVVLDCDLTFQSDTYCGLLASIAAGSDEVGGVLLSFRSNEPCFSYASSDLNGFVTKTAEKDPISDRALIGSYGFGSGELFFHIASDIVGANQRTANGEFYVSAAYNALIAEGYPVVIVNVDNYWSVGTPSQLASALGDRQFADHARVISAKVTKLTDGQ